MCWQYTYSNTLKNLAAVFVVTVNGTGLDPELLKNIILERIVVPHLRHRKFSWFLSTFTKKILSTFTIASHRTIGFYMIFFV